MRAKQIFVGGTGLYENHLLIKQDALVMTPTILSQIDDECVCESEYVSGEHAAESHTHGQNYW